MAKKRKKTSKATHQKHFVLHEYGTLPIRVAIGLVFLIHGYVKLFGMGIEGVGGFLASLSVPLPLFFATVVSILEFAGGLAILLGLFTRWAALLLAIDMLFAWLLVHLPNGFFISGDAIGYEFVLTLMLVCLGLFCHGAGHFSLEKQLFGKEF